METAPRVALFTDTIDDLNGVAIGLRRLAAAAARASLPLALVGAGARTRGRRPQVVRADADGIFRIPTIVRRSLRCYPEMVWGVPRPAPLARWLVAARADLVQCATPGPMGLAAMAAARALGLPVIAQYHTEVAEYARRMIRARAAGRAADRLVGWFYRHADLCLAPSRSTAARLAAYGVDPARIAPVPRGTDLALFHPSRRDRAALARHGVRPDQPAVLYVGRLSREKNLERLLAAHALVRARRPDAVLLVVGSGPIASSLRGDGVILAGPLAGAELAAVYASADLFAFPSETETFGNVVVEAQAAGLPVVVAAAGAAHEQVAPGETGLVVDGARPDALAAAVLELLADPARRARMGRAAHAHAQRFDVDAAARATFALYLRFLAARETACASRS